MRDLILLLVGAFLGVGVDRLWTGFDRERRRHAWSLSESKLIQELGRHVLFALLNGTNHGFVRPIHTKAPFRVGRSEMLHEILARGGPRDIRVDPSSLSQEEDRALREGVLVLREDVRDVSRQVAVMLAQGGDLWSDLERRTLLDSQRDIERLLEWTPSIGPESDHDEGVELAYAAERGRDAMRALQSLLNFVNPTEWEMGEGGL